jgi:hypothetical protein
MTGAHVSPHESTHTHALNTTPTRTDTPASTAGLAVGGAVLVAGVVAAAYRRNRMNSGVQLAQMDVTEKTPLVETPSVIV